MAKNFSLRTVLGILIFAILIGWFGRPAVRIILNKQSIASVTLSEPYAIAWRGPWTTGAANNLLFTLTGAVIAPYEDGLRGDPTKHLLILKVKIKNEDLHSGLPTIHQARLFLNPEGDLQPAVLETVPVGVENFIGPNQTLFDQEITFVIPAQQTSFTLQAGSPTVFFEINQENDQLTVIPL